MDPANREVLVTGFPDIDEKIKQWMKWDRNNGNRADLRDMVDQKKHVSLRLVLLNRLEFGTAGLRGVMGVGFGCMNDLVVIQTSQGLASFILSTISPGEKRAVVVGYDGRHNSRKFAELTTVAFVSKGFTVYLYSRICPTPFVPFAVTHFNCYAGIMITASHNPKEDNGYKVYWKNGAQIVSPLDRQIQQSIMGNLVPWENAWDPRLTLTPNVVDPWKTVMKVYYEELAKNCLYKDINAKCSVKFTYTPMHGVGQQYMMEAFKSAGFKGFISVDKQMDAHPDFPTVKFPNPEEGKSALDLAIRTATRCGSTLILANDPDADRLAVAEQLENSEWKIFNGNEIGALLGWWALFVHKNGKNTAPINKCVMIASTVSSKFLRTMAQKEGFTFIETLTGFKWMGNKAYDLRNNDSHVLFAFEEAIGFMMGTTVLDKDGISAGVRLAELVAYLETEGLTLTSKLQQLYDEYGYHVSENSYYICRDPGTIQTIFSRIRNLAWEPVDAQHRYPTSILKGKFKIVAVRDLTTGYDSGQPNQVAILPTSRSSQMITFTFDNGLVATLRTSGTEPKIKYYTELRAPPDEKDYDKVKETLHEMVGAIVQELLRPDFFNLEPQSDN